MRKKSEERGSPLYDLTSEFLRNVIDEIDFNDPALNESSKIFAEQASTTCDAWEFSKNPSGGIKESLLSLAEDFSRGALESGSYAFIDRCLPTALRSQMIYEILQKSAPHYASICLNHSAPPLVQ